MFLRKKKLPPSKSRNVVRYEPSVYPPSPKTPYSPAAVLGFMPKTAGDLCFSSHQLPDLVFVLHGIVDLNVVDRVDSVKGRLRSTFESIPDAAVSMAILTMQGGKKGLFGNSTNLCGGKHSAIANFTGQNGKTYDFNPAVKNSCGKKGKRPAKRGRD